jgi:hypothetical protein
MTLHEFLSNHSMNRLIDKVFIGWYARKYTLAYVKKTKEEWQNVYAEFMNETERPRQRIVPEKEIKKSDTVTEPSASVGDKSSNKGAK